MESDKIPNILHLCQLSCWRASGQFLALLLTLSLSHTLKSAGPLFSSPSFSSARFQLCLLGKAAAGFPKRFSSTLFFDLFFSYVLASEKTVQALGAIHLRAVVCGVSYINVYVSFSQTPIFSFSTIELFEVEKRTTPAQEMEFTGSLNFYVFRF